MGADDLPQQRGRRAPDPAEHRARPDGARLRLARSRVGQGPRAPRLRVGARRARHRHARLHARPARRADQHDQQRDGGRGGAQAALRAGPDPLQPHAHRRDRGLQGLAASRDVAGGPDLAADARVRRAADRASATGPSSGSPPRSCSSRSWASCSARASSCRWRRCTATSSPRRSWAPANPMPLAISAARARCTGCWPTTRRTGPRTASSCRAGSPPGRSARWRAARQLQPIWSQISEKVVRFEDSLERSRGRQESLVGDIGLETPKEVKS